MYSLETNSDQYLVIHQFLNIKTFRCYLLTFKVTDVVKLNDTDFCLYSQIITVKDYNPLSLQLVVRPLVERIFALGLECSNLTRPVEL